MQAELLDHRKFLRLVRLLGEPTPHVLGYLMLMWRRGYQTGSPVVGDDLDVEAAAEFTGESGRFAKAAKAAGFVDQGPDGLYRIHDLWDHAPEYARKRMARAGNLPAGMDSYCGIKPGGRRAAAKTAKQTPRGGENGETDAARHTEIRDQRSEVRGQRSEREEEEKSCSEPPKPAASEPAATPPPPPVLTIPAVGEGDQEWPLTQAKIDEWGEAYPGVDVLAECRKARQWCIDNPTRRKTAKGMPRFLSTWLSRAQDQAPRTTQHGPDRRGDAKAVGNGPAAGGGRIVAPATDYAAAEARHVRVGGVDAGPPARASPPGQAAAGEAGPEGSPGADRGGVPW
jgi:hypothetical protein